MPNSLDANGLVINTQDEIIANLTAYFQATYGSDINLESSSPDGQLINILAQEMYDLLSLINDAYNSMDPDSAYGVGLDRVCAMSGTGRGPATQTTAPVLITADQALTLEGASIRTVSPEAVVFTVQDTAGNPFELVNSYVFSGAASTSLTFQAVVLGAVQVIVNTITKQTTPTVGITAVNNPSVAAVIVGVDEETDANLRIRRASMYKLASVSPAESMRAALMEPYNLGIRGVVPGATDVLITENDTGSTVGVVPAHSLYAVIKQLSNAAQAAAIAAIQYKTKAPGCGMYGGVTEVYTTPSGSSFTGTWDWAVALRLYAKFTIVPRIASITFGTAAVAADLSAYLRWKLKQKATIGDLILAMNALYPDAILTVVGVSLNNSSWTDTVTPSELKNYFTLAAADITIS